MISLIPILHDNYCYALTDSSQVAVIDPGEAAPVIQWLGHRDLDTIILTHHHGDHVGGVVALKEKYGAKVIGPNADLHRLPFIDIAVGEGDGFILGPHEIRVIATPGHTSGHVCYYLPADHALFCGDTLFSMGCGRLFEGTAAQMWESLQKLAALPDETLVYCGHEYTLANGRFALSVEPDNVDLQERISAVRILREAGKPTLPVRLGLEKKTNPFLRAGNAARFASLRLAKDNA